MNIDKYKQYREEAAKIAETEAVWWKPTEAGEIITGKVISIGTALDFNYLEFEQKVIKLDSGDGKIWLRGVSTVLERELNAKVIVGGEVISIIYRGQAKSKEGANYKKFEVVLHERAPQKPLDTDFKERLHAMLREDDE